ncbi:glycosyltransferase [Paenibacillus antarcticus]|uniref:Glycosyltransferase 2-like domain-containing protein n=1 Tax=Paenibacillus antarcticus TaxID=253703 RepID=A0A168PRZ7_9BACL|nr:glycosyltransferase [Paenibacillus antarcticus]OAB47014.1 hypothetical protein PBAT_08090 [Paenibacillus antarcticus]
MPKLDISLCMIMKDEELHLERCLSSIHQLVSEIIIADTGSHDKSVSIAHKFGAQVIHIPWEDDFAKARNTVLQQASCSWILVLDADEEADNWQVEELCNLLNNNDNQGYFLSLKSYVGETIERSYVTDTVCRLFRNDTRITFSDHIHESVAPSIWEIPDANIAFSSLRIKHYGYLQHELVRKDKGTRNLNIIQHNLQQQPGHLPLLYALGTEYYQLGDYESASTILIPLLRQVPAHSGYTSDLYLKSAYALYMCRKLKQSEDILLEGIVLFPDFTDLLETYAFLLAEQNRFSLAYEYLQKALKAGDVSIKYSSTSGSGTYRTHWVAGTICEQLLLFEEALRHYEQSLEFRSDYMPSWRSIVPICLLSNQIPRLLLITEKYHKSLSSDILMFLTPSALNSRSTPWLSQLRSYLPTEPETIVDAMLIQQSGDRHDSVQRLEVLLHTFPNHPMILSYLWAITYESEMSQSTLRWMNQLIQVRPDMNSIQKRLEDHPDTSFNPLNQQLLEYGIQLFIQTGSWNTLLALFRHSSSEIHWSTLPQSILAGLLQSPQAVQQQWCQIFLQQQEHHYSDDQTHEQTRVSSDISEWLYYASIAQACGEIPELNERIEESLCHSREVIQLVALAYYKLLRVDPIHTSYIPIGSICWPLLFRSYISI